jgi:hypothetical protein
MLRGDTMPNTVVINRPGSTSINEEFPDEVRWSFTVNVNGRGGVAQIYSPPGTSEGNVVAELHRTLMADPDYMEGVASTGGGGGGSPATAAAGSAGSLLINPDAADNDDTPKMKTADGT